MSHGSTQVSSGNIAPKVEEPQRDTKEVMVLAGVVLFLAGLLAAVWLYSQTGNQAKANLATERLENAFVPDLLNQAAGGSQANLTTSHPSHVAIPAVSIPDIIHADIYFEVGRKGLTGEGKAQLAAQADMLKQHEDYGVLIQGYTDQQGSANYNKQLGLKRAETVKAELIRAGIAEYRIQTVSLGEEGVLCIDTSDTCRSMNRRVHVEVRKIGQEHMILPPAATMSSESLDSPIDPSATMEDGGSTIEGVPPSSSDPTTTLEPATGS